MTRVFGNRLAIVAGAVLLGGCASSQFEAQRAEAERRLERAEAVGVDDDVLDQARHDYELAGRAETRAREAREEAIEQLAAATEREQDARGRLAWRQQVLSDVGSDLQAAEAHLRPAELEYEALRDRGLTIGEAEQVSGPRLQLLRQRVRALRQTREAMELNTELARLEVRSAEAAAHAAEAQLRAAERRMELAGVLYDLAAQRAATFELEDIHARSLQLQQQLKTVRP